MEQETEHAVEAEGHVQRGYTASKDDLLSRLAKIEGQIRGISRMVDNDRYCIDIITQISAVQAALGKVELSLLEGHMLHCLLGHGGGPDTPEAQTAEVMSVVARMMSK
ncbi:MAG: metal-sensitive transcriptional regulator [Actinomycetota bacterium]|nr:metal-sensitive transcriptional regulator [Actinomycetota bacterium]